MMRCILRTTVLATALTLQSCGTHVGTQTLTQTGTGDTITVTVIYNEHSCALGIQAPSADDVVVAPFADGEVQSDLAGVCEGSEQCVGGFDEDTDSIWVAAGYGDGEGFVANLRPPFSK